MTQATRMQGLADPTTFELAHRIRFSECDPAGIVFYPQYFVLFNDLLEAWIDAITPEGFADMIKNKRWGLPTVHLDAEFFAISRMGDDVILRLHVERLGTKSLTLALDCRAADGEKRMAVKQTIVTTSLVTHQAIEIPAMLRQALAPAG